MTSKKEFSQRDFRMDRVDFLLPEIIGKINNGIIEIRTFGKEWSYTNKVRYIESIFLKMPLGEFYFNVHNKEEIWYVIDGSKRIQAIKEFFCDKSLNLKNAEFSNYCDINTVDDLSRSEERVVSDTTINTFLFSLWRNDSIQESIYRRYE